MRMHVVCSGGVGAPKVASCDGEYKHNSKKNTLTWSLPIIDKSNKNGSMEFTIPGRSDDFFPIQVYFASPRSYCDIQVCVCTQRYRQVV